MKKIVDIKFWWILGAAVIMGLVCHVTFGFSFWGIVSLVCLIWVAEKFARVLYLVAGVMLFGIIFSSYMPQTASKIPWGIMKTDLEVSKVVDTVQVKADEILEAEKNRQKEALLKDYTKLLKEGKVADARRMMDSIDNLFYPKKTKTVVPPTPVYTVVTQTSAIKDSVFPKGIYYIDVNGATPFNIVVVPTKKGCNRYSIVSPTYNHKMLYSDGELVQDGPDVVATTYRETPIFRLLSETGDRVKLIVR